MPSTERAVAAPSAHATPGRSAGRRRRDRPASEKRLAVGASLLLVAAVLLPVRENRRRPPRDGFPLSPYPMFSAKRSKRHRETSLIALDAAGQRVPIPYTYAGVGGLNQVRRQINRAVARGDAADLCHRVAARLAAAPPAGRTDLVAVQVVTGDYDLRGYFAGRKTPVAEVVHATVDCDASRGGGS